jgi:hypothetical protein
MSRYWDDAKQDVKASVVIRDTGIALVVMTTLIMGGCPHYRVWQQGLEGEAELKRAQQNRQIAIEEARAKLESAKSLADAEIVRAEGAAKANRIIADGLGGPEGYLRYLWIEQVAGKNGVIYVPTEAGLPILEAGKRAEPPLD